MESPGDEPDAPRTRRLRGGPGAFNCKAHGYLALQVFFGLFQVGVFIGTNPLVCHMTMDRIKVSWNEFRKMHKGLPKEEISEKWGQYKEGAYDITVINESPRSKKESKALKKINAKTGLTLAQKIGRGLF